MAYRDSSQTGFHIAGLALLLAAVGIIGFAGYKVVSKAHSSNGTGGTTEHNTHNNTSHQSFKWTFDQNKLEWLAQNGTVSTCKDPFIFDQSPVDLSQIMVIGMPGAYRGYNYKPHGGMRLRNADSGKIDVRMPTSATLVALTRYYEGSSSDLQYLLTFETDCGIAFRFDHLHTLAPALQAIAETTPQPKKDDTRIDPNISFKRTKFRAGDLVATEVGFPRVKNFGFDFGVYDYRHRNQISKNQKWAAIHNKYQSLDWFATCWLDQLPGANATEAKELGFVVVNPEKPNIISDYCSYAPHTTLDFNNGQPTDG